MLLRAGLALALLAVAAFGVWEIRRWSQPAFQGLLSPRQHLLRLWGLFLLLAVLGLWLGGTYLPTPPPGNKRALIGWIQYWIVTVLLALPLVPLALLDWRENLRRLVQERKKLFQETIGPLAEKNPNPPPSTPA